MGTKSIRIPEVLTRHYDLLCELEEAKYILANLSQQDKGIEAEREFIRQRVETLEKELSDSEKAAAAVIETLSKDSTAWMAARLHYLLGWKWEAVALKLGISPEAASMRVYRVFWKNDLKKDPF